MTTRNGRALRLAATLFTSAALVGAGLVGNHALTSVQNSIGAGAGAVADTGDRLALVQDATLRLVARSQAGMMGSMSAQLQKTDSLATVADSVRRLLVAESTFGTSGRRSLELIGMLRARIEVRLAVAGAHRDNGDAIDAFREEAHAARTLDTLLAEVAELNSEQIRRTAAAFTEINSNTTKHRRHVIGLLITGLLGAAATLAINRWI